MSLTNEAPWGADVPISMPEPMPEDPGVVVPFGGLAFTAMGVVHDLTSVDRDSLLVQGWGPGGGVDGRD